MFEFLVAVAVLLFLIVVLLVWKIKKLKSALEGLSFGKKSLSVKYGKMSEQFFPFMKDYPYNAQEFRFIGSPIDGVQFDDDKIIFVEFKTGSSGLSAKQKKIKGIVESKKVEWKEFRI